MTDYKLVPVEPTDEMIGAAREHHEGEAYLPVSLYKAMLAAAPAVQGEPVVWQCVWPGGGAFTTDSYESAKNYQEGAISSHGEDQAPFIRPLFADPKSAEQQPDVTQLVEALDLALEYWRDRQQRYKNRRPKWVIAAESALAAHRKQQEGEV